MCVFDTVAMPTIVNNAKIACLDFSLQKAKMHLGVSVVIDDPEKLTAIRERWALYGILLLKMMLVTFQRSGHYQGEDSEDLGSWGQRDPHHGWD